MQATRDIFLGLQAFDKTRAKIPVVKTAVISVVDALIASHHNQRYAEIRSPTP